MRVTEALRILEAATRDCKTRDIDTPDVRDALDVLEPYCWPDWRIEGFRNHLTRHDAIGFGGEGQQQTLRVYFGGIYGCVRTRLSAEVGKLNYQYRETKSVAVKTELDRLTEELMALPEGWQFLDER